MSTPARALLAGLCVTAAAIALPGSREPANPTAPGDTASARATASPATTGTTSATSTSRAQPREVTLVATGDVLLHEPLWRQAEQDAAALGTDGFDFTPILAGTEELVAGADLAICHVETPLAPRGGPYSGYPAFSVPPEIAPALAETGYDACSTASNHVYDQGAEGVDRTLDELDAADIAHAGSARSRQEAGRTTTFDVEGVAVALLSYTWGFNGIPAPGGETWRSNLIDEATILADARTAQDRGAELVIVSLHWGDEYDHQPNARQQELAPRLIASPDIDLLLGHHAHVVQPIERTNRGWIVYGMGNHLANQATLGPEKAEGLLVRFTFTENVAEDAWEVTKAEFAVLLLDRNRSPRRLVVVADALADPAVSGSQRQRLQDAWDRTTGIVLTDTATDAGLTPIESK